MDLKRAGERLQAARLWISQAQEAFDKKKDIRGELDLLLAQAELRRVREANRSYKWWYKHFLLRQFAAFGLAVIMITAGIGGAYWLMHRGAQPKTMPQVMVYHEASDNPAVKSMPSQTETSVKSAAEQHRMAPETTFQPTAHQTVSSEEQGTANAVHTNKYQENALQHNVVSPDEMQRLVRSAGKSLRGQ